MPNLGPIIVVGVWAIMSLMGAVVAAIGAILIGYLTTLAFGVICFIAIEFVLMVIAAFCVRAMR